MNARQINIDDIFTLYAGIVRQPNGTLAGNRPVIDLYKSLTDEDRWLIMLYFRWVTLQNRNKYGIKSLASSERSAETKAFLESMKPGLSKVTDWEFVGMIDFGYQGAVHCSRGNHALRYAYYAYSPSTEQELIFGLSCGSDFFDMDPAMFKGLQQELDKAKYELGQAFEHGRCSTALLCTDASCILDTIARNSTLAGLCLNTSYIGRTPFELWSNFVSKGIMPPKTLLSKIRTGYRKAAKEVLLAYDTSPKMQAAIDVYEATKLNDSTLINYELMNNPGISYAGEIIAPFSACNLFDALRAAAVEEFIEPTVISKYYDMLQVYSDINTLESFVESKNFKPTCSRADLIMRAVTKSLKSDITNLISLLTIATARNDLRLLVTLLGLSPNSSGEVPLFHSDILYSPTDYFNKDSGEVDYGDETYWEEVSARYSECEYSPNVFQFCWNNTGYTSYAVVNANREKQYYNTKRGLLLALYIQYMPTLQKFLDRLAQDITNGTTQQHSLGVANIMPQPFSDKIFRDTTGFNKRNIFAEDRARHGDVQDGAFILPDMDDSETDAFEDSIAYADSFDEFEESSAEVDTNSSSDIQDSDTDFFDEDDAEEEYYEEESFEEAYDEDSFDDEEEYSDVDDPPSEIIGSANDIFNMLTGGVS